MCEGVFVFIVALAVINGSPLNFDGGTEYEYDYTARIHMKTVEDFEIYAQVYLTNIGDRDGGQELRLRIQKFTFRPGSYSYHEPKYNDNIDLTKWYTSQGGDMIGLTLHNLLTTFGDLQQTTWESIVVFSFVIGQSGEIINVYHEANEIDEILAVKKGIVNMVSGKFLGLEEADHVEHEGKWFYNTIETGHEGEHNASYSVESNRNGLVYTKNRTHGHNLPYNAYSSSTKNVVIDPGNGTIHSVSHLENTEIKHETHPGFDPFQGMREVKPVSDFEDVDIPGMEVESNSNLVFKGTTTSTLIPERPEGLVSKSIAYDESSQVRRYGQKQGENVTTLLSHVKTNLKCIRDQPANGSSILLGCSTDLVKTLLALPDDNLTSLVDRIFSSRPNKYLEDTIYQEAIIDSLFMMNTRLSQQLILKYALKEHSVDLELFRRSIFHLGSLGSPPYEDILNFVERVLDEDVDVLYGRYGSETLHIMLLSFGSLSHKLMQSKQGGELPLKFNKKIKDMLGVHDPYNYRLKRSTMTETETIDFDCRKVVYLEALGNERHPNSFEHIVSHANSSVSSWVKRAAVHALRYYNHTEAAKVILAAATEDENTEVRHEALLAYQTHPASVKSIAARFKRSRSMDSNGPEPHSIHKRGLKDLAFKWRLEVPGVDWRKVVGSSAIGAAFGVIMINNFDLKISPLSGHFKVEVHDEVYARATLGFIGLTFDYFSARVCFKGGAEYNLNLLQEYDPRLNLETVSLVTEGLRDVAKTIKTGIDLITDLINGKINFKLIIDDFLKVFKALPSMVLEIRDAALQAVVDFGNLVLEKIPPFLQPMKDLIDFVSNLMSDIKIDVMDFFYMLVQTVETTIPRAAEQIFKSVKGIVEEFPNLFKDPKKSLARIGGGVVGIALSISELKSVRATIAGSILFAEKKPYWMDIKAMLEKCIELTKAAFKSLWEGANTWVNATQADDPIATITGGKMSQNSIRDMILDRINAIIERLLAPFDRIKDIGDGFIERFLKIFNLVSDIKEGYNKVKTGFKAARALIDKVFGPKFHTDFPKRLRDMDTCPKNGFYPSKLDHYSHDGVDILVNESSEIVAPLSGIVQSTDTYGEAKLVNITELPIGQYILIQNVELAEDIYHPEDSFYEEKRVPAGATIGKALKSRCSNHIHVVLMNEDGVMDPSRLLAPRPPEVPQWRQYCNDKRVVVKGDTKVAEPLVKGIGNQDTSGELNDDGSHPEAVDSNNEPSVGSGGELYDAVKSKRRKKRSFTDTLEDVLDALVTRTKAFLEQFSIRRIKLGQAFYFLKKYGMTNSVEKLAQILKRVKGVVDDAPCIAPSQMTDDVLQTQLINRGLPVSGDRNTMIKALTNPDSRCPLIAMAMQKALNMHCFYTNDCLEMECCVSFELMDLIQKTYKAFFKVDIDDRALYIGIDKWTKRIPFPGSSASDTIDTGIKFELIDAALLCKYNLEISNRELTASFGCGMCSTEKEDVCINFVYIIKDAVFGIPYIADDGNIVVPDVDFGSYFDREAIKDQLEESADALLDEGMLSLAEKITEALGVTDDFLKPNPRCPIAGNMDEADLEEELEALGLSVTGTREDMENRLTASYITCTTNTGVTAKFPDVHEGAEDVFMYSMSRECMRIDACLDVNLPLLDVTKTLTAAIELDPCNFKIYLEFENFKKSVWLIDYAWGRESRIALTDSIYLRYTIDKTDDEFVLSVALVCNVIGFDSTFIDSFHIPIPICNKDFKLPGSGDLMDFAESMAGRLSQEAFDIFTETLGIHGVLQSDHQCTLPPDPTNCDADPADVVPPLLTQYLRCKMLDNCWGVSCCLDFGFDIPFSDTTMNVSIPFVFKYDPCQYYVEMSVGNSYNITRWFVEYEWGKINKLTIGKGTESPVTISYSVDKFETGFTIDVDMSICLPFRNTEKYCIPETVALHLIENEHIPGCSLGIDDTSDGKFPDFSLKEYLLQRGREIGGVLGEAGRDYVLEYLNLDDIVLPTACDRKQSPYSPSVNGWNIECGLSHTPDLKLPDRVTCHVASDCKTISCCVDVPQIDLSVQVNLVLDICQNTIVAGLEDISNQMDSVLSDYKWGENKTIVLAKVFEFTYSIEKPATNFYIIDAGFKACFERTGNCLLDTQLVTGLEIPRVYCRSSDTVNQHLADIPHQCSMDADLMGITCKVVVDQSSTAKVVYFRIDHCQDRYTYVIDDLRWHTTLSSLTHGLDYRQDIDDDLSMVYSVNVSAMSYYVNIHFETCQTVNETYVCDSLAVISDFPMNKTECSPTTGRRKRRDLKEGSYSDVVSALKDLYARKATSKEVNDRLNSLKIEATSIRDEAFETLHIDDSDSATKVSSLVKALGKGNPMAIAHADFTSDFDVEVKGAQAIRDILSDTVTVIGKGSQLYVAGSGLTEHGVHRLGQQLAVMTIGDLEGLLELNRVDPKEIQQLILDFVDLAKALYAETISLITSGKLGNAFESFDIVLKGQFGFPRAVQNLFTSPPILIPMGPVIIIFQCGADYYLGMDIGVGVRVMSMVTEVGITPYAGLSVWGSASFGFILYAEIRLTGYIMEIRMPTYAELDFSRFPLDVGLKMDLVMVPLRLQLDGLVTLSIKIPFCCRFRKVLFKARIWQTRSSSINANIINNIKEEKDESPPQFNALTEGPQKRSASIGGECTVRQLEDLDYTEPAFEISVDAVDDKSQVKFFLDVGTYQGGFDTLKEFQLGGALTKLSMTLRHTGVPLYFTVHAQNSQGSRASVACKLKAYDVTVPSGRVDSEFLSTSNPHVLSALVTAHDESDLTENNAAMGYGEDVYGDQILPWHSVQLDDVVYDPIKVSSNPEEILVRFSGMIDGKLIGGVLHTRRNVHRVSDCAQWCLSFPEHSCLSINYDFGTTGTCQILKAIKGHDHITVKDGLYAHYERLGTGLSVEVKRTDLMLYHNFLYKVNLHMINSLQYTNVISSTGVLIDLSTPEPGIINNMKSHTLEKVPCLSLIPVDRPDLERYCVGLDHSTPNHRVVIDGPDSKTVFNGRHELYDEQFTRINNYISANWDGFHDNETSIRVYTWAVGMEYCEELIQQHTDPHSHLSDVSQWNHQGQIYPIPPPYTVLPDGQYYITVRALNGVEYGGPFAITVCHTTKYTVDTSPPLVDEIDNIRYDEKSFFVYADIAIRDDHSGISEYDICLGKTSRECDLLGWYRYDIDKQPSVSHRFQIPDGVPAWLRIRAVNNVQLSMVGVAPQPIVVDASAPFADTVNDGDTYKTDLEFSKDQHKICANWNGFYDPESGISEYLIGFGSQRGLTDILQLKSVSYKEHHACLEVTGSGLVHGSTYYAVVYAINGGIVQRNASAISDGVTLDITPPVSGTIVDGVSETFEDLKFSSSSSTLSAQWRGFSDPESDISEYSVKVLNTRSGESSIVKDWTRFEPNVEKVVWKNAHLNHKDYIKTFIKVTNGATNEITRGTDGYLVDLTAPVLQYIHDGIVPEQDIQYQSDMTKLSVNFNIEDLESGLRSFKFQIFERYNGHKKKIWPVQDTWYDESDIAISTFQSDGLDLTTGAKYTFIVRSQNNAMITSTHETSGVIIDNTPPSVRWFHVGVFSGENEDIHDGFVYQADHNGIKLSFLAIDAQSGITDVVIKIGTSKGSDDIKPAEFYSTNERDLYIGGLQLEDTTIQTMSPVYYVTLQVQNGAGQPSDEINSTPIVVVPEDVPGNVVEGIVQGDDIFQGDIDYSYDDTTMAITFNGFKSTLHGIQSFVWAVGTSPDREDVVPFTESGLTFEEEFDESDNSVVYSGTAHLPAMLNHGQLYFVTLRGITHNGHALQSITDGVMIDKTPPTLTIERLLDHDIAESNTSVYYETSVDTLSAEWAYGDSERISSDFIDNIGMVMTHVGTFPGGFDILPEEFSTSLWTGVGEMSDVYINTYGLPNFLGVTVENRCGLSTTVVSHAVVVDDTAPEPGQVTCSRFAQPKTPIRCEWSGFTDMESPITHYKFYLGSTPGDEDVLAEVTVPASTQEYFINTYDELAEHGDIYYATVVGVNSINMEAASFSDAIYIDTTPPIPGTVVELAHEHIIENGQAGSTDVTCDSNEECMSKDITCQKSLTSVSVAFSAFEDEESDIKAYYIGVGTSDSETDIVGFIEIPELISERTYTLKRLNLMGFGKIYVSIMAVNGAGLSSVSTSNGVYISYISQGLSPLSTVGIWDADRGIEGDIDYQVDSSTIFAEWDTSGEPCPAVKYEWKILRLDDETMQDYTDKSGSTGGYNDQLDMKNGETYYSVLRVTNADGFVYVLRSDGVTIHNQPLVPGTVYDGDVYGYDLNVLPSTEEVTCNWDGFGEVINESYEEVLTGNAGVDHEVAENQQISRYEVALGTDRRFQSTRTNIVPFTSVGMATSYTFTELELVPGTAKYYCTVLAYSSSLSTAQAMSNGFFITLNGGVSAGEIKVPRFTASQTTLEIPWQGFTSEEDMMLYYVALSTHFKPTTGDCKQYIDGGMATDDIKATLFDVQSVTNVGSSTYAMLTDLQLLQGHLYYVIVMGVDRAGECNMTVSNTTIDVTDPKRGLVTGGPYYDMGLSYTSDSSSIRVKWNGYTDDVSGIASYTVSLWYGLSCENDALYGQIGDTVTLGSDILTFTFSDVVLEENRPYYVKLVVENGAGLSITDITDPILLDTSVPRAGTVVEGTVYTDDVVWSGSTSQFTATLLHYPTPSGDPCPPQTIPVNDSSWSTLEGSKLVNDDDSLWNTIYNPEFVRFDNLSRSVKIKMSRDSKTDSMQSGGYWRTADLETSGSYEILLKAASEIDQTHNNIITEMLFVDDSLDSTIHSYNYPVEYDWSDEDCSCCFDESLTCSCSDCVAFLESFNTDDDAVESESNLNRKRTCGFQIYSGPAPFGILWCQFEDSAIPIMNIKFNLPSGVYESFNTYKLTFDSVKEDTTIQKCLTVNIDDSELGSLCGIPNLGLSTHFLIHVWNRDMFLPNRDHDLFTWNVYAEVKAMIFPPAKGQLCRYGDPFRGGSIPIVRYEAAIGSSPGKSDIQPFTEVYWPCLPCTDTCSKYNCDEQCDETELSQLVFTLRDLQLQSIRQNDNISELIINYLTVKAVLGSGNFAVSSSNGFYVDITPPTFDELVLIYIDVDQGDYVPVEFQGSKRTIKAIWLCNDEESEITEYEWAIGSGIGLQDIQPFTSTGNNPSGLNDMLEGILEDKAHYYISIICTNEAGLTTRVDDIKGVVVLLEGPDPNSGGGAIAAAEPFDYAIEPPDAMKTTDPTSIGATWKVSDDPSVQRYDFGLGGSIDVPNDILPYVWVGYNTSGEVKIENGCLLYNGEKMYDLNELRADASASSTGGSFNMEPGRVIFVSIRMCNRAERCTLKHIGTVTIVTGTSSSGVSDGTSSVTLTTTTATKRRRRRDVPIHIEIITPPDLLQGQTIMVVPLTEEDLTKEYTSSGSSDFVPYIVNPNTTLSSVERVLLGRIREFQTSFTIVTVGQFQMPGPMFVTYTQVNTNPVPGDNTYVLIHWNTVDQEWKTTALTCQFENGTVEQNGPNSTTTVKVCNTRQYGEDADIYFREETQFAVVLAKADVVNNAPSLVSPTNLSFNEDTVDGYVYQVSANDPEKDEIGFLLTSSEHGTFVERLDLTQNGSLTFQLCTHCFGTFTLEVQIYDIPQSTEVPSNSTTVTLNVTIVPVNDQPNIFLVDDNKNNLLSDDITEELQIFRNDKFGEAAHFTAIVGAYDYDIGDTMEVLNSVTSQSEYTVEQFVSTYTSVVNCNESWCLGKQPDMAPSAMQWTFARISYSKSSNYTGTDTIKVAVRDSAGALSDVITLSIYNLEFPCLNGGICKAKTDLPCDNPARLSNFDDNYSCVCPVGWIGMYCGEDVDECNTLSSPCSTPTVCKNSPGSYSCEFPLYFIIPVALGLVVIVLIVTLIMCRNKILRSVKGGDTISNFGSQIIMRVFPKEPAVYPASDVGAPSQSHSESLETSFVSGKTSGNLSAKANNQPTCLNETNQETAMPTSSPTKSPFSGYNNLPPITKQGPSWEPTKRQQDHNALPPITKPDPSGEATKRKQQVSNVPKQSKHDIAFEKHVSRFRPESTPEESHSSPQKYSLDFNQPETIQRETSNMTVTSIGANSVMDFDQPGPVQRETFNVSVGNITVDTSSCLHFNVDTLDDTGNAETTPSNELQPDGFDLEWLDIFGQKPPTMLSVNEVDDDND